MLDWRIKGLWRPEGLAQPSGLAADLFGGDFAWPVMVAKRTAIDHNIATMAAYCAEHGFSHAPHGKTTMSPSLFEAQLRAGAWAITVATSHQLLAARKFGVPRVIHANELLDPVVIRWLATELGAGLECLSFVDSVESVRALAGVPLPVLIELGFPGGRAGCRTLEQVTEVARAIAGTPGPTLAGVTAFEGMLPTAEDAAAYLIRLREAALMLAAEGFLEPEVIVTAGGSAYFDVVARELSGDWLPGHSLRIVLRSGAYVTHDHGYYKDKAGRDMFRPALELWAQVLSTPEPGLAIAGCGKRDAPQDEGLPVPLWIRESDGTLSDASACTVTRLNDQHAYVQVPSGVRIGVGDLMCFGISHPCTAFDKWRVIPLVEDDYSVSGYLDTYF
jgi:D-serine deaminase-like pyridoxal phosphate-dependent protein